MNRLLFLMCIVSIVSCKQFVKSQTKIVSPEEVQELMKHENVQILDVRTPKEYDEGFIEGAKNISFYSSTFSTDIEVLDKHKPIIVYCKMGGRSAKSAKIMKDIGFTEVYDLEGGITKWKLKRKPIKTKH